MTPPLVSYPVFSGDLEFTAQPEAVYDTRRFTEAWLRKWQLEEFIDIAVLIVSELVTNSVKATGLMETAADGTQIRAGRSGMVTLRLRLDEASLVVEVQDDAPRAPVRRKAGCLDEDGRGLALVAALARAWGYRRISGGKSVWAEMEISASRG